MAHPLGDERTQAQLRFFGQVTASVTHEVKNHLALINEYNGLAADLLAAHARGRPLDVQRLGGLCQEVRRQVREGGQVVGQLNRFAHSVEAAREEVDLVELLATFAALSRRRAQHHRVEIALPPAAPALRLATQPFLLLQACSVLLEAALKRCPDGGRLEIGLGLADGRAALTFCCAQASGPRPELPAWLMAALGAELEEAPAGGVRLTLPLAGAESA
ncbi:MAG: hypothetical protein ACOZHQ_07090 [Thermodesulfobacteriota bacterium]